MEYGYKFDSWIADKPIKKKEVH